ncbi:MAG: ABC transporter ATP-binding protein [Thermodesulfobacteriota bacterium]
MTAPAEELSVSVRGLTKRFGDFVAVRDVTFSVRKGEIFGFLGPNGAGKSTTIRMLCGLLVPSDGEGTVAGFDLRTGREKIKQRIGYMSQRFSLYDDLTVEENIDFFGGIYGIPPDRKAERKDWVLGMSGLAGLRGERTAHLPAGFKQQLALGCALLHDPLVLFLDEPTSGVDPIRRRSFWDLIHELAGKGVTVFVTTHYMDEAEYCDRLCLIYRGELAALGTPEELKSRLMKEAVLEVRTGRPRETAEMLAGLPGIRGAALYGESVHAVAEDADEAVPRIRTALEEAGFPAGRVERIAPTLEDVFVSLVEERDRREEAIREVRR